MACGMCESHVNEAIRVCLAPTGYEVLGASGPYVKKGFSR